MKRFVIVSVSALLAFAMSATVVAAASPFSG